MTPQSKDMWIDAVLYVCIGVFAFLATYLSSDEAYKYINPAFLFYAKGVVGVGAAGSASLKMFRSTSFSDHKNSMNGSYTKPPENPPATTTNPSTFTKL